MVGGSSGIEARDPPPRDDEDDDWENPPPIDPEHWKVYQEQLDASDGFDTEYFPGIEHHHELIYPLDWTVTPDFSIGILKSGIEHYNMYMKLAGESPVGFDSIVKLNARCNPCQVSLFYTFEAKDKKTYQVLIDVITGHDGKVQIFRQKGSKAN